MIQIQETSENNFLVEVTPNSSLEGRARLIFLGSLSFVCLIIGIFFFFMGAILILPFAGLEVTLVLTCFYLSFRWSQQRELIFLTNERIKLERGRLLKEFTWEEFRSFTVLRVEVDNRDIRHFSFRSKGKQVPFGSFLNEDDKLELQRELQTIIGKLNALSPGL
ncbi:DUF2244 domain-containing protein [Gammaproteobacteria bacterium]|nr:DUF2244 domain-containing protein [Gammaproteobacteria bacterium]